MSDIDMELNILKKDFFGRVGYGVYTLGGKIEKPFFMDGDAFFTLGSEEILGLRDYRPLLYPKSHFIEEIVINRNWFCPADSINKILEERELRIDSDFDLDVVDISYVDIPFLSIVFDKLDEWMIDYRCLIDLGLAIDVTTIKENPYAK
jgi:hypothetical protein